MSLILSKILFIAKIPSQLNFGLQSGYFAERIRREHLLNHEHIEWSACG